MVRASASAALLLAAFTILSSCNTAPPKKTQAELLASLDSGYQSSIFTKEEYDAKRAAIVASVSAPAAVPAPAPVAAPPATTPVETPAPPAAPPVTAPVPPAPVAATQAPPPQSAPKAQAVAPKPVSPPKPAPSPKPEQAPKTASATTQEPEPAPAKGCEDAEYKSRQGGQQSRFFPAPPEAVKKAVLDALNTLDFNIHKNEGNQIEASKKRHIGVIVGAGGEREILQLEATTQDGHRGTLVTGETKKSVMGRLAQKSWTAAVLAQTACNLR